MAGRVGRVVYNSRRWQVIRQIVKKRDGYKCRNCGFGGRLEVDHIVPIAQGGDPFDLSNLRSLCRGCHLQITGKGNRKPVSPERAAWNKLVDAL